MEPATAIQLASESLALCSKVITELKKFAQAEKNLKELIKNVERVRQSSELLLTVIPEISKAGYGDLSLVLQPCAQELRPLINDILARASAIVAGQPKLGVFRRLQWTFTQSQTEDLAASMKKVEERIQYNVNLLTLWASMRHLSIAQKVQDTELRLASRPEMQDAFSIYETVDNEDPAISDNDTNTESDANQTVNGVHQPTLRTWLGYNITLGHDAEYLDRREALSDAAYHGQWEDVFRIIELGNTLYGESWVNATRIREPTKAYRTSLWAPIHQAAYWRAPLEVFQRLIALGASRTLRTNRTNFAWPNMSALELALEYDVHWAGDILRPIICLPVPQTTIQTLQEKFHALILRELEGRELDKAWLHLPVLEVLTEYESGSTWFPIRLEAGRKSGYMYRLDLRHLLVWSVNMVAPDSNAKYRITEEEVFEVHEALVFPLSR